MPNEADLTLLYGDADETFHWEGRPTLQPSAPFLELEAEPGARLSEHVNSVVRGGGTLSMPPLAGLDWLVRARYVLDEGKATEASYDLGTYFYSSTQVAHGMPDRATVELYDESIALTQDGPDSTYQVASGTVITRKVREIILAAWPLARVAITDDVALTLRSTMTWEPKATWLQIANDLLAAANYFSLYVDRRGVFVAKPYQLPRERGVAWSFVAGENCIHLPSFNEDQDTFAVPNKVIAIPRVDGTTTPLEPVVVTNENPASPYSKQSRGRWVRKVLEDVEAVNQATLLGSATRALHEAASVGQTLTVQHAFIPGLEPNDVVYFRDGEVKGFYAIAGMEMTAKTPFLVQTSMRRVEIV